MASFYGWDSTVSRLQSHYEETVYFLPFSFQEFLVLNRMTSEGWKVELTLEPPWENIKSWQNDLKAFRFPLLHWNHLSTRKTCSKQSCRGFMFSLHAALFCAFHLTSGNVNKNVTFDMTLVLKRKTEKTNLQLFPVDCNFCSKNSHGKGVFCKLPIFFWSFTVHLISAMHK